MLRRPAAVATAVALTLGGTAAPARALQPVTIDFAEYASPTAHDYEATFGAPLTSKGFDFYQGFPVNGSLNVLSTWGTSDVTAANQAVNRGTSTGMFSAAFGGEIDLYAAGDDPFFPVRTFNIFSIDVAHLYSTPTLPVLRDISLQFFGFTATGREISQTFDVFAPPAVGGVQSPVFQHLTFSRSWRGLVNVFWSQSDISLARTHQFTNVQVQLTPEPGTWLLLGTGLAVVLVAARRRHA